MFLLFSVHVRQFIMEIKTASAFDLVAGGGGGKGRGGDGDWEGERCGGESLGEEL